MDDEDAAVDEVDAAVALADVDEAVALEVVLVAAAFSWPLMTPCSAGVKNNFHSSFSSVASGAPTPSSARLVKYV